MGCKKPFTRNFISQHCTDVFVTKPLKQHREDVLLDREKSLLPETQPYVEIEKQRLRILDQIKKYQIECDELSRQQRIIQNRITEATIQMHRLTNGTAPLETERRKFIRKCPMTDCRGFLSTQWKCGSCDKRICNKCNEERLESELNAEGDHLCKPENVATTELLNKDTKPCPECGTLIFRVSGCNHMFCVDCHCSWDWSTQTVLKGNNTNPHYYEFMRNNGGNVVPQPGNCGNGLPELYNLRRVLEPMRSQIRGAVVTDMFSIYNVTGHVLHYELERNFRVQDPITTNRKLRVQYLLNAISEDAFKRQLQINERAREKINDFRSIYQMFCDVSIDTFRNIINFLNVTTNTSQKRIAFMNETMISFNNLIYYFNDNLKKTSKLYKCTYGGISTDYHWVNNLETHLAREQRRLAASTAAVTSTN
jgi:hypothetical protein